MDKAILEQIGLSKGEAETYTILLKIGEATASEIAKQTKIARPNIYDYLNKLKEKGLISFITKENKIYYTPLSPEKILDYLNEKRESIEQNLPEMLSIYQKEKKKTKIEVYEGPAGLKILMNDVINEGKDFIGWGASDKVKEYLPEYFIKRYVKQRETKKIKAKMLVVEKEGRLRTPFTQFKEIPKEYSSTSTTVIYGNKIGIIIYILIPITIIIESEELANSYRKHFELLYKKTRKKFK